MAKKKEKKSKCECDETCTCGCQEDKECTCEQSEDCCCESGEKCHCEECSCDGSEYDVCDDGYESDTETKAPENEYLTLARQLQADFDNYRKRSSQAFEMARLDGKIDVIKVFLSPLDSFKKARSSITDPKILEGIDMIEKSIKSALTEVGVVKIESIGKHFDPNLHNAIATTNQPDREDDIIIDEYQSGYKLEDKIIRYSQVIVNKKEN